MPTVAEALTQALKYHRGGNFDQAERLYHLILQADPNHADAHHLLGVLAYQTGRFDLAVQSIGRALALNPKAAVYHSNLGLAQQALNQMEPALASFQEALRLKPDSADAHNALGNALRMQGRLEEAAAHCRQALRQRPAFPEAHNNLGSTLLSQGRAGEAMTHLQEALRLRPEFPEAHNNLANALLGQGRLDDATEHCQQALRFRPDFPDAHIDLALLLLLRGDFERGWREYEWRWRHPSRPSTTQPTPHPSPSPRRGEGEGRGVAGQGGEEGLGGRSRFPQPLWDGSALDRRTILLHAEQGLGDTVHFIRYVPLVRQRCGKVIVACQPALLRLLASVPDIDLVAPGFPLPAFDVHAPLLGLPGIFRTTFDNIPAAVPYLHADAKLVEHWRRELRKRPKSEVRSPKSNAPLPTSDIGHRTSDFLVGIAWQGNPWFSRDRQRSIPLASFARLAQVEGVQLISLQKGPGADQLEQMRIADGGLRSERQATKPLLESAIRDSQSAILDLGSRLDEESGAFMDTAALMKNLDLVISSDTAVAHLAGALAVPVWVALALVPDWRWLLQRADSPWYPTMRLFRQRRLGDWDEVFEDIALELGRAARRR